MVYILISGILVGGAVMFIGNVIQEQEQESQIVRKVMSNRKEQRVPVRDNGTVQTPPQAPTPQQGPGKGGPRALV